MGIFDIFKRKTIPIKELKPLKELKEVEKMYSLKRVEEIPKTKHTGGELLETLNHFLEMRTQFAEIETKLSSWKINKFAKEYDLPVKAVSRNKRIYLVRL